MSDFADRKRSGPVDLDELSAFAILAWGLVRRSGLSAQTLTRVGRMAKDELERAGGLDAVRAVVAERLAADRFPGAAAGTGPAAPPALAPGELRGAPLGPGRARGPVAILAAGAAPQRGAVLVSARPGAELDAALAGAAALVVEVGNVSARPVRAARARGLPVVRLASATARLRDAAEVEVDGDRGTVNPTPA